MDFEQIRSVLAVARLGSFTLAARERGMTQPGISRQVQRIERELGAILFDRHAKDLRLTTIGEHFLTYAESATEQHDRMLVGVRGPTDGVEGDLRVIASTTPAAYLVPSLVARFRDLHPRVRPAVAIGDSAEVVAAIQQGRWDLGFTGSPVKDQSLRSRAIAEDEVVLAVPARHPLGRQPVVRLDDLTDQPFLDREEGSGTLDSVRAALAQRRLTLPPRRVVMVLSSCQAMIAAVRQGLGIGFVSALALDQSADPDVVGVRLAEVSMRRQLYLVYRGHQDLLPVAKAFVDFVEQEGWPSSP